MRSVCKLPIEASHFTIISKETMTKACLLNQRFLSKLIQRWPGYARACAPLRYYNTSKGTPPDEPTIANSLIDHVFAPPGTSTRSSTVLTTLTPCYITARKFSPSLHEASRSCRNKNTSPIHTLSYICSLARCKLICSRIAKPFR